MGGTQSCLRRTMLLSTLHKGIEYRLTSQSGHHKPTCCKQDPLEAGELLAARGAAAAAADWLLREVHAGHELSGAATTRLHGYLLACGTEQSIVQVNLMCDPAIGR